MEKFMGGSSVTEPIRSRYVMQDKECWKLGVDYFK